MSRCFPFTPRGCVRKGVNNGAALIESIKLQNPEKGQNNIKKGRKTRKEERKKLGDQKGREHERIKKAGVKRKHSQNGNEQVERSYLTEEHGHPLHFQNPAYLSDSTQSNDKRKNDSTLLNYSNHPEKRCVIGIKINLEKQSDRRKETAEKKPDEAVHESKRWDHCSVVSKSADSINKCKIDPPCFATGNQHISTQGEDKACSTSTNRNMAHKNRVPALELQYKNLTDGWNPEQLQSVADNFDDADWLSSNSNLKRHKATTTRHQTCRSVSLWPRAQYLPEASIYALPYSLPF